MDCFLIALHLLMAFAVPVSSEQRPNGFVCASACTHTHTCVCVCVCVCVCACVPVFVSTSTSLCAVMHAMQNTYDMFINFEHSDIRALHMDPK